jgi:hypothetical protein
VDTYGSENYNGFIDRMDFWWIYDGYIYIYYIIIYNYIIMFIYFIYICIYIYKYLYCVIVRWGYKPNLQSRCCHNLAMCGGLVIVCNCGIFQ